MKKKILILGSTGSIGRATLDVIRHHTDRFEVLGLVCKDNIELLNEQIGQFHPSYVGTYNAAIKDKIAAGMTRLFTGDEGIKELVRMDADIVVNALPGSIGLNPTIEALKAGKVLALANKESLVMAGRIVSGLVREQKGRLIPVDSEHSALFQLLGTLGSRGELKEMIITASGGPFREYKKEDLERVSPAEALNHPTWKMGPKVTLDSATLMNKGLEVIEARWLFDIEPAKIRVMVHPESIVHGIVELTDGSFFAHLAYPDMKIPISYAINECQRVPLPVEPLRFDKFCQLTFFAPDIEKFPSLRLAYEALDTGDSATIAMNASNEVACEAFIQGKIRFTDIPGIVEETLGREPRIQTIDTSETVWEIHRWAKEYSEGIIKHHD